MTPREQLKTILLEKSVKTGEFTLASGKKSDLYVDCRTTTINSEGAILVGQLGWECLSEKFDKLGIQPNAVGGMTLGADPISLAIGMESVRSSAEHSVQTFVVRKEPKGHGRGKQVEGNFNEGDLVVAIEDTVTTGGSVLKAIDAIEKAGGIVGLVFILVDREEGAVEKIEAAGYPVVCLFTKTQLLG